MGAVLYWLVFLVASGALAFGIERLFPDEVDAIIEMLGFGDQPQWRR